MFDNTFKSCCNISTEIIYYINIKYVKLITSYKITYRELYEKLHCCQAWNRQYKTREI